MFCTYLSSRPSSRSAFTCCGPLTPFAVEMLRLLRDFFGVTFQLDADLADGSVLCTCRGVGFKNLSKRTT